MPVSNGQHRPTIKKQVKGRPLVFGEKNIAIILDDALLQPGNEERDCRFPVT